MIRPLKSNGNFDRAVKQAAEDVVRGFYTRDNEMIKANHLVKEIEFRIRKELRQNWTPKEWYRDVIENGP